MKILASERLPPSSADRSSPFSSPFSSGATPTPSSTTPGDTASEPAAPVAPAAPLDPALPTSPKSSKVIAVPFGSDVSLEEFLRRLLPLAHLKGTTYADAADNPLVDGCTAQVAKGFADLASKSIPSQPQKSVQEELDQLSLVDPLASVSMKPAQVALFEAENTEYRSFSQLRAQFDALQDVRSDSHTKFIAEVTKALAELGALLKGTKNLALEKAVAAIQQSITTPTFTDQYSTYAKYPIATNAALIESWAKLDEARVMMDSRVDSIDRKIYGPEVAESLREVTRLAADVDKHINDILVRLEELRMQYHDFPSSATTVLEANLKTLAERASGYEAILKELKNTSSQLIANTSALQDQYETNRKFLEERTKASEAEAVRLQREQNLIVATIELLGRMYIEHETAKQNELEHSSMYTAKLMEMEEEKSKLAEMADTHASRVKVATNDTEVAIKATEMFTKSVKQQAALLQNWTDEVKSQHTDQGSRALDLAHHSAVVKFNAYNELWSSAKTSIADITPAIKAVEDDILTASVARSTVRVEQARRQKQTLLDSLPLYEKERDDADAELDHLENSLFPSITQQRERYGQAPLPTPPRDNQP